jgi:DNA-binding response OmpR family regulator
MWRDLTGCEAWASPPGGSSLSILLIDDDAELCSLMREFFAEAQCQLDCAYDGRSGLSRALSARYDVIILDVMLPVINGFTVLQQLRKQRSVPVIMLTARGEPRDRVEGLNTGADDYLPKPFDPDELLARIRAVLRRAAADNSPDASATVLRSGAIEIRSGAREAYNGSRALGLTSLEFDLFLLLGRQPGRVVAREEIMAALFERQFTPYDRSLDVHISHLRKKIAGSGVQIRAIRNVGYVLTADTENA